MDIHQQNRPRLEPIQEESEQEDETEGSRTGEDKGEEEDSQVQVGMETEDESEEDEDDDAPLRALRPRRLSRSLSHESFPQMQSTNNNPEEMENISVSDLSTFAMVLSDEATPPGKPRLEFKKRSSSGELRIKVSKIRRQNHKPPPQQSVQKKTKNSKRNKKLSQVDEPFPEWLVELMVNIEEATTHQLVVE
ncbi:mitotic apparatus protein p62-like [Thunnus maccoyii]|uniref:mitotic apparatus protein p62-like n=1 Tax=Thunnus maccoyii TaxID=8240 RepID=UPI001C4CFE1B|nr:mitotic apparatus protein p62-like [Thunnus maccoyii]